MFLLSIDREQIGNPLFRQLAVGRAPVTSSGRRLPICDTADCPSAPRRPSASAVLQPPIIVLNLAGRSETQPRSGRIASPRSHTQAEGKMHPPSTLTRP